MKPRDTASDRLDRVLRRAHAARTGPPPEDWWVETVMRRIRGLPEPVADGWRTFGLLVWRLAPATGALALLALAVLLQFSLLPDAELLRLWYSEPRLQSLAGF